MTFAGRCLCTRAVDAVYLLSSCRRQCAVTVIIVACDDCVRLLTAFSVIHHSTGSTIAATAIEHRVIRTCDRRRHAWFRRYTSSVIRAHDATGLETKNMRVVPEDIKYRSRLHGRCPGSMLYVSIHQDLCCTDSVHCRDVALLTLANARNIINAIELGNA